MLQNEKKGRKAKRSQKNWKV